MSTALRNVPLLVDKLSTLECLSDSMADLSQLSQISPCVEE